MRDPDKTILLVDDDIVDVKTTLRALQQHDVPNPLCVVHNGAEALAYLRREGEYADAEQPAVILLDLNMPVMNGIEFLHAMKSDERLKDIPVVVLTTSREESDLTASQELGAAGYIVKPLEFGTFLDAIRAVDSDL